MLDNLIDSSIYQKGASLDKLQEAIRIVLEIIENLDEAALKQLLGGNQNDIDTLLRKLVTETYVSLYGNEMSIQADSSLGVYNPNNGFYLEKLNNTVEETLRIESLTYFLISVMPDFEMNWHHVEWAEAIQTYLQLCILAARGHGKSYMFSNAYPMWRLYRYSKFSKRKELSSLGKEGYMFSFSKTQAVKLLRTCKETISNNDILRDKLKPGSDGWAETKIELKNGTRIIVESAGASTRGAHPGWIVVDDFLKDNVLYSKDQRDKYTNYFYSVIKPMLEPGGQIIVVGTPFHAEDLYGNLKEKKGYHVREYPSIFPDGKILWSNRFTLKYLLAEKNIIGSVNFSREYLVRPISNESSIFPYDILEKSLKGMTNYKMVNNIESFPIKFKRTVIGVDLAISAKVGADYTVFAVLGLDEEDNIWILKIVRLHGKSYQEQISHLKKLNIDFRPDIIQIESNGFQAMFSQAADSEGLPVHSDATTSKSKNDLKTGLPGIALLFERGKIKMPIGDAHSKEMKEAVFSEFASITFTNNGLQATSGHDDIPMAIHQGVKGLDYRNTGFGVTFA